MKYNQFEIREKIWRYPGKASWHFLTIPPEITSEISKEFAHLKRGFGSLRVKVTIGETSWKTSIFPDTKSNTYWLPIKGEVRVAEKITSEKPVRVLIEIIPL